MHAVSVSIHRGHIKPQKLGARSRLICILAKRSNHWVSATCKMLSQQWHVPIQCGGATFYMSLTQLMHVPSSVLTCTYATPSLWMREATMKASAVRSTIKAAVSANYARLCARNNNKSPSHSPPLSFRPVAPNCFFVGRIGLRRKPSILLHFYEGDNGVQVKVSMK